MSVLISGVLMNPAGVPVSGAEVTFSALTNGPSVLNGFSASVMTDQDGNYAIPLEICEYAISIQSDGYNSVYGSVSINEKSTPATINELLKLAAMEQTVTPAIIVYFRDIQADVAAKLAAMQVLGTNAAEAASTAATARDEAAQYAQNLSAAVAQAQQASAAATTSANNASNSANGALVAKNAAETAAGNAQATLAGAMLKGQFGWGGEAIQLPSETDLFAYFSTSPASGLYKCLDPINRPPEGYAYLLVWERYNQNNGVLKASHVALHNLTVTFEAVFTDGNWPNGWVTNWNNRNLFPVTTSTPQTIDGEKSFKRDNHAFILSNKTEGAASYIIAKGADNSNSWFLGRGSANNNDASFHNYVGKSAVNLKADGTILLAATNVNVAGGSVTLNNRPVLTVDEVAPPRLLSIYAFDSTVQGVRIKLRFRYTGNGNSCLLKISGGAGYNSQINQHWVASLQIRSGNQNGDGLFTAILNTDFGNNPISYIILITDPNDVNAVFVYFQYRTNFPGDTSISLVDKFFIDLSKSDISGTLVNLVDVPQTGRLPTTISRAWTTLNTTVDSNGNIKSASPIIKLFSDGSSELNTESEGVVTARLSEGVYHITGCLGLNADRAWGGEDGGITNPKCRNGYERIWNDYEVQEDGSLIIRTYHRVHSDAMPFAQNRLNLDHRQYNEKRDSEEWADRSPIDIPLGTYLTVRVQMPAREEDHYAPSSIRAVSHSNVYCNSVSPA
ncbi:phage tail fiber protein [Pectobacterium parvum]|uniref:phage tail fiber protein n=1 Tax=Pectobacterium parvum TaxID=2778550 RepID=UPI0038268111